jgi:alanyl aminopeptidase
MKLVTFAVTEPLPAEVVAFAVGPFDVYEGKPAGHGTPIRVITTKGHAAEGHAAAEATVTVLPRLEAYTGIPYPYGKLDHVALPEGAFGAVENPGLITYRQRGLLHKPDDETLDNTRPIRAVEAHEIAHQWFGDMVTQATWEDVWLSEGFATWLAAKVMDQEQAPARVHLNSIVARERIMGQEASSHPRPVRLAMTQRDDLYNRELTGGVYSQMVYQKGAAILLMLEGWLGEDKVRDGLRSYLKSHRFGNASTEDLAAALRAASGIDPLPVMKAFLDSTGIPLVRGEIRCATGAAPVLHVEQTGAQAIPVCWHGQSVAHGCTVLTGSSRDVTLANGSACPGWVYWNAGATGYYRTAWTQSQLAAMPIDGLTAAERLALIYDLAAARKAGADVTDALRSLAKDAEPEIAKAVSDALK